MSNGEPSRTTACVSEQTHTIVVTLGVNAAGHAAVGEVYVDG